MVFRIEWIVQISRVYKKKTKGNLRFRHTAINFPLVSLSLSMATSLSLVRIRFCIIFVVVLSRSNCRMLNFEVLNYWDDAQSIANPKHFLFQKKSKEKNCFFHKSIAHNTAISQSDTLQSSSIHLSFRLNAAQNPRSRRKKRLLQPHL